MRRRFFLMYNPAAGTARVGVVAEVERLLVAAGATVTRATAASPEAACAEARAAARSGAYDAIVAAGGDGTIRQAATAVLGTDCPAGAIMIGTGNVLAHELSLPRSASAMAAMLRDGPAIPVAMARANGAPFLLMAGAGLDGRIIAGLDQATKQRLGKVAFTAPTLKALRAPLDRLTVTVDGMPHACCWAIVTSAERYGGAFRLTSQVSLRTPGLAAILFHSRSRTERLAHAIALARGCLDLLAKRQPEQITILPCRHVHIDAASPVPIQIDGDAAGCTPLDISADGGQVALIVPEP
jgi:diacylglycerol kinase family enzyme